MGLPPLVLQALAFAVDFLKPFGMEAVLQMSNSFRPFNTRQEMALSTNTLTYAHLLAAAKSRKCRTTLQPDGGTEAKQRLVLQGRSIPCLLYCSPHHKTKSICLCQSGQQAAAGRHVFHENMVWYRESQRDYSLAQWLKV